ncbi:MAG TPA: CinA family nicotinamide mononucleotide deamidase-related protein [Thermoanaerobaculia bacterium]|nr:CinA family nicotinamide mononucleotide deamidase-related protein [Thermoanaerobaculia bacterium]
MRRVKAAIIAVGSEMLGPVRVDTNSLKITVALEDHGIEVARKSVVGDRVDDLVEEVKYDLARADMLFITGGLGPTEDDITRDALAKTFSLEMELDHSIIDRIEKRFAARGWKMPEVNKRQAYIFRGQTMLTNERGTAPGFHLQVRGKHVWVYPGVPHELEWMIATYLRPWLRETMGGVQRYRRVLKVAGLTESGVEERLKPYYEAHNHEPLTILASGAQIELHLQGTSPEAIASREQELLAILGQRIYGFDYDTLEAVIGRLLVERKATLATAESCTGGLVGSRITDVPGSSRYYLGGGVCYEAKAKIDIAGVDRALIEKHGEVSEEVAVALATGIRKRFDATYGVGVTGIAGPSGGSEAKPVGTVHIAVASADAHDHRKMFWPMPRPMFKWFASQSALDLLRMFVLRESGFGSRDSVTRDRS